jgi:hypothetical protein
MELTGQIIFDAVILIAGFLAAWAYTRIFTLLDRLGQDLKEIPEKYVAKDDYREERTFARSKKCLVQFLRD